ncbi:hypothetical protein LWC34_55260 [Kibdelosporangium philippinense]|uniref:Putative T7SS secretion signal domain-containing protein n=1 Tax=Kibdelosporangium philippinense TaxID=211113 RepID=A0ABS8ZW03_9PSEU|nr:hypothetical protein [Kibdelosporangium philippinense]MCE7011915.1 hypothetical protein [Kibdelosporangium philippinense]
MTAFPALGFDPAAGNVGTVRELAKQMTDTGGYAREANDVLKSVQDKKDVWTGEAAKAFTQKLGELPKYLDDAHKSLDAAGKALSTWSDRLAAHQKRAQELEQQAKQAKADAEAKDSGARSARSAAMNDTSNSALHDDAVNKIGAANAAWDKLDDIRAEARKLRDTWEDDGATCAKALNDAAEDAPNKAFFESFGELFDDFGKWFKDHLGDIGDIAGIVSAVAGALSFIPILAPICGPIALIAGGVALAAHAADMTVNEKWDDPNAWVSLAGDAVGLIPGATAIRMGFGAAADAISGAEKVADIGQAVSKGSQAFAETAGIPPDASRLFTWIADRTVGSPLVHPIADVAAKGMQGGSAVALQIPGAIGLFDSNSSTVEAKNWSGARGNSAAIQEPI